MKTSKVITIFLFSLLALVLLAIHAFFSLGDMCGNRIIDEFTSPNGKYKAVSFERDCGATTDYSTQISIIKTDKELPNDSGNIFSADTNHGEAPRGKSGGPEVRIKWNNDNELEISYHEKARTFFEVSKFGSVNINYNQFQ